MPYSPRFEEALVYANRVHAEQMRKGTEPRTPYIIHLLSVAALVGDYGGDEDQVIAGLLHDAPEDQGGKPQLEEIRRRFGERVARIVEGCTDTFEDPKPPWRARKETYIQHLASVPPEVLVVSAADKLSNGRSIVADLRLHGDASFDRFKGKKDGTLWYYREVTRALEARGRTPLTDELRRTVHEMHRLSNSGEFASA